MSQPAVIPGEIISQVVEGSAGHSMSVLSLILDASVVVQLVMLILMLALFLTCYIIVLK